MKTLISGFGLAAALLLAACGGGATGEVPTTELKRETAAVLNSGRWSQQYYVVNSEKEWAEAWQTYSPLIMCIVAAPECSVPARPAIDFERYTLIGVFEELSPGVSMALAGVEQVGDTLHVYISKTSRPCICAQVQTPTSLFFLVPKTNAAVRFHELQPAV